MSYSTLAPHYHWLERLTFGGALQAARCACLHAWNGESPQRVLLLGDGDGRFLERALKRWPESRFTSIDQSEGMQQLARQRCGDDRVRYVHGDALERLEREDAGAYDVVVTHFFVDCFLSEALEMLTKEVHRILEPGGSWFVSEFRDERAWQRAILWLMYRSFHLLTGAETPAKRLPDHAVELEALGFEKALLGRWRGGFVVAERWTRSVS